MDNNNLNFCICGYKVGGLELRSDASELSYGFTAVNLVHSLCWSVHQPK
ncbi:hypothetical protein IR120_11825 [Muribacter muris]|nr:hypothetical protein [Muribacter muris]MBF0786135.1 hypothetical protein [Muribacter muris]MBF0827344.1 hypothetical protein [Muribacter muris]